MMIIPNEGHPMPMPIPEGTITINNDSDGYFMYLNEGWHSVEYVDGMWLIVDIPEKTDDNAISS
jgi:hypothetical protein